jgi:signal transduction histidine kinase
MDIAWPRRPPFRDACIAAVITIVAVVAAYAEAHPTDPTRYFTQTHPLPRTPTVALLLVVVAGTVLAWRHRYPRAVLCVSAAAVVAYSLAGWVNGVALLLPAVAMGTLATRLPIRRAVMWAAVLLVVLEAATVANNPFGAFGGGVNVLPATIAVALLAGIATANRRAYVGTVRDQVRRDAERDAERRVDAERLRIARELHDVVAHTMATINVQASAASQVLRDRPEQAAESLTAIRAASKEGLRELRAILNVLRHADEASDPTEPAPGLDRLDALVAGVRQAGLPVTVTITGEPYPLPAVTGLAAFRIIQEALTNTIRHAGPATAAVTVRYGSDDVFIEITDTGGGAKLTDGSGHGLRGMRERAAAAGGTVEIGPMADGGFRVAARLPVSVAIAAMRKGLQ